MLTVAHLTTASPQQLAALDSTFAGDTFHYGGAGAHTWPGILAHYRAATAAWIVYAEDTPIGLFCIYPTLTQPANYQQTGVLIAAQHQGHGHHTTLQHAIAKAFNTDGTYRLIAYISASNTRSLAAHRKCFPELTPTHEWLPGAGEYGYSFPLWQAHPGPPTPTEQPIYTAATQWLQHDHTRQHPTGHSATPTPHQQ